jgi:hypothetical protein
MSSQGSSKLRSSLVFNCDVEHLHTTVKRNNKDITQN